MNRNISKTMYDDCKTILELGPPIPPAGKTVSDYVFFEIETTESKLKRKLFKIQNDAWKKRFRELKGRNMHIDSINDCITLKEAIDKIGSNNVSGYKWYPVKTSVGCILEVGGTSSDFIIRVLKYENGNLLCYKNEYVKESFQLRYYEQDGNITLSTQSLYTSEWNKKFTSKQDFLFFIDNYKYLNGVKLKQEPIYKTVFDHYELTF